MGIWQLIMLLCLVVVLLYGANQHGKKRTGNINFWVILALVGADFAILAFGGFFDGLVRF